jgi:hypothetical protein
VGGFGSVSIVAAYGMRRLSRSSPVSGPGDEPTGAGLAARLLAGDVSAAGAVLGVVVRVEACQHGHSDGSVDLGELLGGRESGDRAGTRGGRGGVERVDLGLHVLELVAKGASFALGLVLIGQRAAEGSVVGDELLTGAGAEGHGVHAR